MTDKVQKIREEVERLKSNLVYGSCSSQIAMETRCKEEAYNEVLTLLSAMLDDALSKETKESWNERLDKKDFRERYKRIAQSESFKKAHEGISIGDTVPVEGEEPVSEDLDKAAIAFSKHFGEWDYAIPCFKTGAKWQKEQFEKNRLKHCNSITNEQAELEQGFIDQHLDKHQRMPTFLDAIEYGMRLQKEKIEEALLSEVLPCFMHGGEADEVVAKLDEVLSQKK